MVRKIFSILINYLLRVDLFMIHSYLNYFFVFLVQLQLIFIYFICLKLLNI